jgi:hypothetical protein
MRTKALWIARRACLGGLRNRLRLRRNRGLRGRSSGRGLRLAYAGYAEEQNRQNGQSDSRTGEVFENKRLHRASSARIRERLEIHQLRT